MDVDWGLFWVPVLAVLAPVLARGIAPWVRIPIVVFELLLGIVFGPAILGFIAENDLIDAFSELGLAVLFFLAGNEIDFRAIKGRPTKRATWGWLISLGLGLAAGLLLAPGEAAVIIGIALSSTALGTLLPIIRDAGEMKTPFGRAVIALGAVGEFGPLLAISLFLSGRALDISALVLVLFIVIAALAIGLSMRVPQGRLHSVVRATLHTSSQFGIRVIVGILASLVVLSIALDIDMLLGAFAAGVVWQVLMRNAPEKDRHQIESKIEGLAFGFLVPIFFIYTGVTFDLDALVADPFLLSLVPIFLVLLLLVRGLPSLLAAPLGSTPRERVSLVFLGATGLPIIVAVTQIGVSEQIIPSGIAASLVGAGILSVLLYPIIGMALRGERPTLPSDGVLREEA